MVASSSPLDLQSISYHINRCKFTIYRIQSKTCVVSYSQLPQVLIILQAEKTTTETFNLLIRLNWSNDVPITIFFLYIVSIYNLIVQFLFQ